MVSRWSPEVPRWSPEVPRWYAALVCSLPKPGWATAAAATEEFLQSIQAPSSTHPGISYPVRANPSLRLVRVYAASVQPNATHRQPNAPPQMLNIIFVARASKYVSFLSRKGVLGKVS